MFRIENIVTGEDLCVSIVDKQEALTKAQEQAKEHGMVLLYGEDLEDSPVPVLDSDLSVVRMLEMFLTYDARRCA